MYKENITKFLFSRGLYCIYCICSTAEETIEIKKILILQMTQLLLKNADNNKGWFTTQQQQFGNNTEVICPLCSSNSMANFARNRHG
jgi:hypothetical protein